MSKKSDLISCVRKAADNMKGLARAIDEKSESSMNYYLSEIEKLIGEYDYMIGDKEAVIDGMKYDTHRRHNCTDDDMEMYVSNFDSGNIVRCAGVWELATIDAIEQIF